ncbi:MAG: biotin transporter BioY [Clostridia bacterium]|nr:biotin transporter BioY [Clostridia bacterium]
MYFLNNKNSISKLVITALGAALLAVCSWITIPFTVPFTMQTFGIFIILLLLGGKYGTISIAVYIALGAVGVPVFSGFQAGIGHLLGLTGGYIFGFLLAGIFHIIIEPVMEKSKKTVIPFLILELLICYAVGTVWFSVVAHGRGSAYSILTVLTTCVFPYVIPDLVKLFLAFSLSEAIKKRTKKPKND